MSSTYSNKFTPPSHPGLLKRAFSQRSNQKKSILSPLLRDTSPEGPNLFQDQDYKKEEIQDSETIGIMPDKFLRDDDGFPSPFMLKKSNHRVRDNIIFHSHSLEKEKAPRLITSSEQKENVENGASEMPPPPRSTASNHYVSRIERLQKRREYKSPAKSVMRDLPKSLSQSKNNHTSSLSVTPPSSTQQSTSASRHRPSPLHISPNNILQAPSNESCYTPAPQYSPSKLFSPTTSRHIATGPQGGLQFVPNAKVQVDGQSFPRKAKQASDLDEQDSLIDQKVNMERLKKSRRTQDLDAEMENIAMSSQSAEKSDGKVARLASLFSSRASLGKGTSFRKIKKKDISSPPRRHSLLNKAGRSTSVPKISPKSNKPVFTPLKASVTTRRKSENKYCNVPEDSPRRLFVPYQRENRSCSAPKSSCVNSSPTRSAVSGSSSGYVGWPGTQDKTGETVSLPGSSSEDEIEANKRYIDEGRKECEKWMNDDDTEIESSGEEIYAGTRKNSEGTYHNGNNLNSSVLKSPATVSSKYSFSSTSPMSVSSSFSGQKSKNTPSHTYKAYTNDNMFNHKLQDRRDSKQLTTSEYENEKSEHGVGMKNQNSIHKYVNSSLDDIVKDINPTSLNEAVNTDKSWNVDNLSDEHIRARQYDKTPERAEEKSKSRDQFINTTGSLQRVRSAKSDFGLNRRRILNQASADNNLSNSFSLEHNNKRLEDNRPEPITLSEAAIRMNDEIHNGMRHVNAGNIKGYRGFLDKTKDVPNLMDDTESVSTANTTSASTFSDYGPKKYKKINKDDESDIFDGLSSVVEGTPSFTGHSFIHHGKQMKRHEVFSTEPSRQKLVAKTKAFEKSSTSEYTQFKDIIKKKPVYPFSGMNTFDSSLEFVNADTESSFSANYSRIDENICGDLHRYYVQPYLIKRLVRKYRKMCEIDFDEDSKKSFALLEMRSRIMETDIKRGIARRGGTVVVDDIVLTNYFKASHRVRDAVIVSKAWRDGASPEDVFTAAALTNRKEKAYFIRRQFPFDKFNRKKYFEEVLWADDIDFVLMRCASLGPRQMRGFEMFTIGDCQSILLKLTNDHCASLRKQYNEASLLQHQAEELMRIEADDGFDDDVMSNAELNYLSAMEAVKNISEKLVCAEKSFNLVRDQIEELVAQYETLLDDDQESDSTEENICTTGTESDSSDKEKELLSRRTQRAELKAVIAQREAMMAKLETEKTRQEVERITQANQRELDEMRKKLEEMETKSMLMSSDFDRKVDTSRLSSLNRSRESSSFNDSRDYQPSEAQSFLLKATTKSNLQSQTSKERLKAKFRSRSAQKKRMPIPDSSSLF